MKCFFARLALVLPLLFLLPEQPLPARAAEQNLTNSIGMEFVLIPEGSFVMGADKNFEEAVDDEMPPHEVTLTKAFYLAKYVVTQEQWTQIMGDNPSKFKGRTNPVEQISWEEAQNFIARLNEKEGTARYRLPTEAEWEYAARAGTRTRFSFGDDADELKNHAWYMGNAKAKTHPVGMLRPNPWGLYDMHGNVWEWVQDWYGEGYYAVSPKQDPAGPPEGKSRMLRGGAWISSPAYCRSAYRIYGLTTCKHDFVGFRLAFTAQGE